jgi:hypothetical protein
MIPALLPWAVAGAVLVGGAVAGVVTRRRRHAALEHYCLTRGYRFESGRPGAEASLAGSFPLFGQGRHRRWGATITGRIGGLPFTAFEYSYVTGGGNNNRRHRLTAILWELEETTLPRFRLVPETALNRLAQRFGTQDFDFDDDDTFSRSYQLQGDDEAAVRRLFTRARRAYLTAPAPDGSEPARHHVTGADRRLLWWRSGNLPVPDALDQLLADGDRLRRMFEER